MFGAVRWRCAVALTPSSPRACARSLTPLTAGVVGQAGVDLEPNRPTDRLHNITFRRCHSLNNSGAGFQAFPGNLNGSSLPVMISFEDCDVEGIGFKPYGAGALAATATALTSGLRC